MTQSYSEGQSDNSYVIDAESGEEMARLIDQDRLVTRTMGGLFSEREDLSTIFDVLDIGCGPGGWVLDVAHTYPEMEVTGIDISESMIQYAQAYAQVRQLPNAHFRVMNALHHLDFPAASFDLVNARTIVGFVSPKTLPPLFAECRRVLRPGGVFRITEPEHGFSNKAAFETFYGLVNRAASLAGRSFSPTGNHLGITPVLDHLLRTAGFRTTGSKAYTLNFSAGTPAHIPIQEDLKIAFRLLQPFLLSMRVAPKEEIEYLYEQAMNEMLEEDFCALWYFLTVWGSTPQEDHFQEG
ncbi:MAG: class I SAM-dependent methyltransferase [Ktedonobacteraceae bacterium]|nr:class I SAM-dependent methyltransferase [Ktedonobacteraceae bacterium]